MIIALASHDDLAALVELENNFEASERWSQTSWRAELEGADRLVLVCRDADQVQAVACFWVVHQTAELLRVVVHPAARRRGLARKLIGLGKEWAEAAGAERILLEVRHDNSAALALYEAAGFAPIAQRRDYYGPGRHGVVMECQLPRHSLFQPAGWPA
ncbi:MAG: GNAT family N-acetyltransferase [Brooklawnia sp.]|jgi:ribosomal-protein-alanine N-acetyltransferase